MSEVQVDIVLEILSRTADAISVKFAELDAESFEKGVEAMHYGLLRCSREYLRISMSEVDVDDGPALALHAARLLSVGQVFAAHVIVFLRRMELDPERIRPQLDQYIADLLGAVGGRT